MISLENVWYSVDGLVVEPTRSATWSSHFPALQAGCMFLLVHFSSCKWTGGITLGLGLHFGFDIFGGNEN